MAAQVFDRRAEVIQLRAIEYQKPVVEHACRLDGQRRVLFVELRDSRSGYRRLRGRCYRHIRPAALVREDVKRHVVAVAVDKHDALRRPADESPGE